MPSIDLALEELWAYKPAATRPRDFDQFWAKTLHEAGASELGVGLRPTGPDLAGVNVHRLWYAGLGGARISGWYVRPSTGGPFPAIVVYHGYGGRGGRPLELYSLAAQGAAVLSMDCRGQGGDSDDIPPLDGGHYAGWLTRGLRDPLTHYYRYVFADAARAIDALISLPEVDGARVAVTGFSQGGGLALAAASLSGRVSFVWADMPFLCDFRRAVEVSSELPYLEVATFLRRHPELGEVAYGTLAYFDVVNHAPQVACPAVVSVGLWDATCPPSTIFGTFGRLPSDDKELIVLPYHGHELTYEVEERRFNELISRLSLAAG